MNTAHAIEVEALTHRYAERTIYRDLQFSVPRGRVVALLGKNGVGKTTLIRILMGFLRPVSGRCRILGEDSHNLSAALRTRIGLLFEGHLAYDFMTIEQIERFYRPFYPRWRRDLYYDLVDRLALPYSHRIGNMSCGQRSQVVLGLIFAQDPELMILDDYSMGLDAGYRRLFLDYLARWLEEDRETRGKTVFVTSHVVQDMEELVDDVIFMQRGGAILQMKLTDFMRDFRRYPITLDSSQTPPPDALIHSIDLHGREPSLYSFAGPEKLRAHINQKLPEIKLGEPIPMSLEDAFIGLTGKY